MSLVISLLQFLGGGIFLVYLSRTCTVWIRAGFHVTGEHLLSVFGGIC